MADHTDGTRTTIGDVTILAGLGGLKAAADMIRALRDGLKAGTINGDEIAGRVGEIYDYIIDSKDALVDAKDEIEMMKKELADLRETRSLGASLQHDGKVYWIPKGGRWDGPFCSRCWDVDGKLVRLDHQRDRPADPQHADFFCPNHREDFTTRPRPLAIDDHSPEPA
jgi:hypothetical protein